MKKTVLFTITRSFCKKYRLNTDFAGKTVVIYQERYLHIEKHKPEFLSEDSYNDAVASLPNIISNPDFISVSNTNASMEFVKTLTDNVLVAVTISLMSAELKVKTMYPITDRKKEKLKNSR